jgi:hypothetical protein
MEITAIKACYRIDNKPHIQPIVKSYIFNIMPESSSSFYSLNMANQINLNHVLKSANLVNQCEARFTDSYDIMVPINPNIIAS